MRGEVYRLQKPGRQAKGVEPSELQRLSLQAGHTGLLIFEMVQKAAYDGAVLRLRSSEFGASPRELEGKSEEAWRE